MCPIIMQSLGTLVPKTDSSLSQTVLFARFPLGKWPVIVAELYAAAFVEQSALVLSLRLRTFQCAFI